MVQIEQWQSLDVGSTHLRALWRLKETHHMTYLLVSLIPRSHTPYEDGIGNKDTSLVKRQTDRWLDNKQHISKMKDNGRKSTMQEARWTDIQAPGRHEWTKRHHNHLKSTISIFQLVAACALLVAQPWLLLAPHVLVILSHECRHTVAETSQLSTAATPCGKKK